MCGIVGAVVRTGSVVPGLVQGLRTLEYRGYDSAGIAASSGGGIAIRRRAGRIEKLEEALADGSLSGATAGIGHTRWATHGAPSDTNAHPHCDRDGRIALVHNGVVENHAELRAELVARGVAFASETDTEVLAHLVGLALSEGRGLVDAVRAALSRVRGYYAIAVLSHEGGAPRLVCARNGPPLLVAAKEGEAWLASDVLALLPHARSVVFLEDGDVCELEPGRLRVLDEHGREALRESRRLDWDPETAAKGAYEHYMLKEIHEQPDVLARTAFDRIDEARGDALLEGGCFGDEALRAVSRVSILGCGTALHAGMIARYMIESLARVPVDFDYASEFRYRDPVVERGTLALAISQSGETADTLAALKEAAARGARAASICNVAGSTLVRESEGCILTKAGPEIGVASTKAFTAQVAAAFLLAVRMGRARGVLDAAAGRRHLAELRLLRPKMEQLLGHGAVDAVREIAARHLSQKGFLFLGRGINFPVALEGALKLKEISYVHAEGYAAGEMKHGPIALIEPSMTILAVAPAGPTAEKTRSNIEQVKARGGRVVAVGSDAQSLALGEERVVVPECPEVLSPLLDVLPLQLVAYHVARLKGCDIDKPRNLAKSVTVE
jgi:glucosamine--fructose-6-phosphate aminotransferase (isomerizing)